MPNSNVAATRAIASTLVQRYFFYPLITLSTLLIVSTVATFYISLAHSLWWLLLFFILLLWLTTFAVFLLLSYVTYRKLSPRALKRSERKEIVSFVKDFGVKYAAAKGLKKSPMSLAAAVVWKFFKGRGKQSVAEVVTDPINYFKDLGARFQKIAKLFD